MSKTAVIYWSGTGNTEAMANAVLEGAKEKGDAELFQVSDISAADALGYDALVLGCPAMGDEVLEESEFEPFFTELEKGISGKNIGIFGSYGWGDGAWMRDWEERVKSAGANLTGAVMANDAPDENADAECRELGRNTAV